MTKPFPVPPSHVSGGRCRWAAITVALVSALCVTPAGSQAPAAPATAAAPLPAEELESLVARIALYPDDLVGIILPGSTNPLQIVQADRFLEKRKTDKNAKLDDKWDDAVKSLLNYPEVVKMMSGDLDWTAALGEAVVADAGEVMEAVQAFRRKTSAAGNLKSDQKQTVVVEKEVIKIVPADPQVIYVPQYDPVTVVTAGYYPSWGYYPAPYPVYYYPYPPGAALATGIIWGAAIGAIWSGGHYGCGWGGGGNNTININRNTNINTGNIGSGNRPGAGQGGAGSSQWKSGKQPGQVSNSVGKTPSASSRVGDSRGGGGAGAGARPSTQQAGGLGGGDRGGAGAGAGAGGGDRGGARPSTQPSGGGGAFDGVGSSGRQTSMDSSRGASSRGSASPTASSRGGASAGGGARGGGGGGGGARGGGGGGGRR